MTSFLIDLGGRQPLAGDKTGSVGASDGVPSVRTRGGGGGQYTVEGQQRIAAKEKVKRGETGCIVTRRIVGECNKWEANIPVAVMVGDVHGNHVGEGTVQTFSEAVRLRMVGRGELMTDGAGAEEFGDHFGKKAATAIGEQVTGSTVVEYDVVQEKVSDISCAAGWDRSSNSVARGVVRRDRDPFVSHSRHRKRAEQVEADTGKRVYGDGNRLKVPGRENRGRLPPLAQFASGHITADRTV